MTNDDSMPVSCAAGERARSALATGTGHLAGLRQAAAAVVGRAADVRIADHDDGFYARYARDLVRQPRADSYLESLRDERERVSFVLLRDAINFGSGYHPWLVKSAGLSGARTIGSLLADSVRRDGLPDARWLSEITGRDCAWLFRQPADGPPFELMEMFATAWNALGRFLAEHYQGQYMHLVEEADGSAAALVGILASVPCWRDISRYDGIEVPFMKRAQLAALGVHRAGEISGRPRFGDLADLTIFADNLIPHVLKVDGLLLFSDRLDARIDQGNLIPYGSAQEVEIRAAAVHVCEQIAAAARDADFAARDAEPLVPVRIASLLWRRGQQRHYKDRPRHRSVTYAY